MADLVRLDVGGDRGQHLRLAKQDPRLLFRRVMFTMARKQAGQVLRRRDTREHVALYVKAFNAWADNSQVSGLRFTTREEMPPITRIR